MPGAPSLTCDRVGACVIIPVFNHAKTVGAVVRGARAHASVVLVLDDGSTDGSGREAEAAGAVLLRHPVNRGKGAALIRLLDEAQARGFRHAIALDADGQHFPDDLPALVQAIEETPDALVIGARDLVAAGAPGSSEFGRRFSNFWVWFECGQKVQDSQSGFRAYPLPATRKLWTLNRRYDYEVEVLLQSGWAGVPLRSVPIRVNYPKDRISHFRPFADNARISLLNTLTCLRLLLPLPLAPRLGPLPHRPGLSLFALRRWALVGGEGPLWRVVASLLGMAALLPGLESVPIWLPLLMAALLGVGLFPAGAAYLGLAELTRRGLPLPGAAVLIGVLALVGGGWEWRRRPRSRPPPRSSSGPAAVRTWTGRSRGGVFGHWFFLQVIRLVGISGAYLALYPVALYFVLAAPAARRASMQFLDRAMGPAHGLHRWVRSYRHFLAFARNLVDRMVLATRGRSALRYQADGLHHIEEAAASGKGGILLTAHLGNWEVAAGLLEGNTHENLAIVAYRGEQERLARFLEGLKGKGPRIIGVGEELASLEMIRSLREGAVLAIQGDRPIDPRVVRVPFLGQEAAFPSGPFVLAAISGAPLLMTFSIQTGPAEYALFCRPPIHLQFTAGQSGRDAQLREWVERYVRELEALARAHPYQWCNFYDFWRAPEPVRGPDLPTHKPGRSDP